MENSDRPEKRRKYVAMKILSVAGAVLSPLLALAFLASSVFSLIANSLGEPGYFDYGVPLRGVSCAAEEISGVAETHKVSVYGAAGAETGVYRGLRATAESAYAVKNTSASPVSAEFYQLYTGESLQDGRIFSDLEFPEASLRGEKLAGERYIYPEYGAEFAAAKKFSSSRYELRELPSETPLEVYEILPEREAEPYCVLVELERGHVEEYVFFEGYTALENLGDGDFILEYQVKGQGDGEAKPLRVYYTGETEIRARAYSSGTEAEKALNERTWTTTLRAVIGAHAQDFCGEGYTEKEAYNLTAYALENGAYNRTASLQAPYKYGAACAFAAWTAELNGGETATLEIRSGLWTTRDGGKARNPVYTLEYRAGNIGGVAQKTLALQSELFIAETSGAELLETLSPAELSTGENVPVKDLHGRGRYALTEKSASFYLYEKAKIASFAENRLFRPAVFFCLAALSVALFVVCVVGCAKPFEGPKRPSDE